MLNKLVRPIYAQCDPGKGNVNLGDCLVLRDDRTIAEVYSKPAFLINLLAQNIFAIAGVVLFFMLLLAGFKFVAGGKKGAEDAKSILTTAIIGFIIMFTAYWIVVLVEIITGINIPVGPAG